MGVTYEQAGALAWQWLEQIARVSETEDPESEGVTRLCATREHRAALDLLGGWMRDAGMTVRVDNGANLIGRYASADPDARTLIMGSHQDTVPHGGKYDGIMGVLLPLALVHYLNDHAIALPFHLDVVAFSDEEGTRFSSTLLGSKVLAGSFDPVMLGAEDDAGVTLRQALLDFGCDPERIADDRYPPGAALGFVEVHIEQGPQLEAEGLPIGVVSAITGIERHKLSIHGLAGHAGTVPMHLRQDALVGAARVIGLVDELCKTTDELVGVVGKIDNSPNGVNVIPQRTDLTVELRSPEDATRLAARNTLLARIEAALAALDLRLEHQLIYEQAAVQCAPALVAQLEAAVAANGVAPRTLFSGAGHDGLAMQALCDIGMLFLRCARGVSHHPDEAIEPDDLSVVVAVLASFCMALAESADQPVA
ncbi:allantoate deiminase [Franzmannia pantelleriensis]|uniref:Allantoate deiminase n=1 Tax=Franzmannia pantelleriensis TaxID=48727 RepID=A0A1G9ML07_9GAMM|nr:M20 family metallo-hydrolase [Halomonas pantelleriensis]SDL74335.1 allantoate deiminase [Halomonas pantelleriensis]